MRRAGAGGNRMRREEWLDREIRTMVQGAHRMMGVGTGDDTPVSPLTISSDPPPEEDAAAPDSPLIDDTEADDPESAVADEADPQASVPPPAPGTGTRRAARRKHNRPKR